MSNFHYFFGCVMNFHLQLTMVARTVQKLDMLVTMYFDPSLSILGMFAYRVL